MISTAPGAVGTIGIGGGSAEASVCWMGPVGGGATEEDSPLVLNQFFDRYMPARENLRLCLEVVPAELQRVGGDIGATSDWNAEVVWHNRWRANNPNQFPPRTDIEGLCD